MVATYNFGSVYINLMFPFDPSVSKIYRCTGFYTPRPHTEIFKKKPNLFRPSHLEQFTELVEKIRDCRIYECKIVNILLFLSFNMWFGVQENISLRRFF